MADIDVDDEGAVRRRSGSDDPWDPDLDEPELDDDGLPPAPPPGFKASTAPPGPTLADIVATLRTGIDRVGSERLVNLVVVATCSLLVLRVFHPFTYLVDNTTPNGGDFGAHVWAPAYLRDHLIPNLRLFGWSPDWYAGFPAYQFYMVIPPLLVVILDVLLPYGIALKLVSVLGVVTMPISAFAFGKLARLRFPAPAFLAVATLPFLFDTGFAILGGNITSTLAGEFNYSCALSLGIVYLGLLVRSMQDDQGWVRTAVVGAFVVMSHLLVGLFVVAATVAIVVWHTFPRWRVLARVGLAALLAAGLTAWWTVPLYANRKYTIDMGWTKETSYWDFAIPQRMFWAYALAIAAVAGGLRRRDRVVMAMATWVALLLLAFRFAPDGGRLWNARLMPGAWLTVYLLAGLGAIELLRGIVRLWRFDWSEGQRHLAPVLALVVAVVFVGLPMNTIWFVNAEEADSTGHLGWPDGLPDGWIERRVGIWPDRWLDFGMKQSLNVSWIKYNYSGYENEQRSVVDGQVRIAKQPVEYFNIMDTMTQVGADHGCGRAHYEYDGTQEKYGTTLAMMLLPYWTDGCIGSMEGLYFESSATTPFHFLTASELSAGASRPVTFPDSAVYRYLVSGDPPIIDQSVFDHGIEHLQLYGVKYFMAYTSTGIQAAQARPDVLTEVAASGPWVVFEVAGSELAVGLDHLPYVEKGSDRNADAWRDTGLALWDPIGETRFFAAPSGPDEWPRIEPGDDLPFVPVEDPAVVSNIVEGEDTFSFDVDQIGKPVLVRVSYFPNWEASGAQGPYRVTPNLMVVVPTDTHVELHYARSGAEKMGIALTTVSIGGAIYWWRRGRGPRRRSVLITSGPDEDFDEEGDLAGELG